MFCAEIFPLAWGEHINAHTHTPIEVAKHAYAWSFRADRKGLTDFIRTEVADAAVILVDDDAVAL